MSENVQAWMVCLAFALLGFGIGYFVFDEDEEEPRIVDLKMTLQCRKEFDEYVRDQIDWMRKHNEELRQIVEPSQPEVEHGEAEKQF